MCGSIQRESRLRLWETSAVFSNVPADSKAFLQALRQPVLNCSYYQIVLNSRQQQSCQERLGTTGNRNRMDARMLPS